MRAILTLDTPSVIHHFGGTRAIIALFAKHRLSAVTKPVVDKWRSRNNMPMWAIVELSRIAKLERMAFSIDAFTIVNQEPKNARSNTV